VRILAVLALILVVVAAGCLGPRTEDAPTDPSGATPTFAWVHTFENRSLQRPPPFEIPRFHLSTVPETWGWEPTIGVTLDQAILVPSETRALPGILPEATHVRLWRTYDEGVTWQEVIPRIVGQPLPTAISRDPYLFVDAIQGRVYVSELRPDCLTLAWSDDSGDTWDGNPFACANVIQDHQTFWTSAGSPIGPGGRMLYQCSNNVATTHCERSLDGGRSFHNAGFPFQDAGTSVTGCGGTTGHGATSEKSGTIFIGRIHCDDVRIARSTNQAISWSSAVVAGNADDRYHDVSLAIDDAGNVYGLFIDDSAQPRLTISRDDGMTWSTPQAVGFPGLVESSHPTIIAGAEGRVAVSYMGTLEPGAGARPWSYYIGTTLDVLAEEPVFVTVDAAERPLVLDETAGGATDGGVGDFLDLALLKDGRVVSSVADICQGVCAAPTEFPVGPVGILVQTSGARLR
jgi:hypothetical protein